jgi:4-amino-4-deoxy-L-arabinose transferase-like glycosyltransferase
LKIENLKLKRECDGAVSGPRHGQDFLPQPEARQHSLHSSPFQFSIFNFQFSIFNFLFLLCLSWLLFFHHLGVRDLWSSHEARAAQDAQTILQSRHWGLPQLFDRKLELQKPPLYYWLCAAVAELRGGQVDAWAVRLPAAGAALGGVLLLCLLGWQRGRGLAGLIAAGMLATAQHYTWLARVGRIDMPLALVVSLTLAAFYLGQRCRLERDGYGAWRWFLVAYLSAAFAVLLKGPIGVLLPAAVAVVFLLVEGELPSPQQGKQWLRLANVYGLWWGVPLLLAITLPWFIWANIRTEGELFQVFFWKHNVERGLGSGTLTTHPWWFYAPRFAFDFLPWSPLLVVLAWLLVRRGWWRSDPEARFGLVWLLTVMVALSCARFKRADYLLPAYPGAALFLGCTAERWYRSVRFPRLLAAAFGLALIAIAAGWLVQVDFVLPRDEPQLEFRRFAQEIRRRSPHPELILFFRAESHPLAFHVGPPIDTILEWENLDVWAGYPQSYYVVMPPEDAREWRRHLKSGQLEEVLRNTDLTGGQHTHPLVLLRTRHSR